MCLPGTSSSSSSISSDFGALLSNTIKRNLVLSSHYTGLKTTTQQNKICNIQVKKESTSPTPSNSDKHTSDWVSTVISMIKKSTCKHSYIKVLAQPFSNA